MLFDFRRYGRLFAQAFGDRPPRGRALLLVALAVILPLWALANRLCLLLDHLLYPGFRAVRVERPVFIVGHAESGTTRLHELLAGDQERFAFFITYELFLPAIIQKKAIRALARLDRDHNGGQVMAALGAWQERLFALPQPQEDDLLLLPWCASGTLAPVFPYMSELDSLHYFDALPRARRERVMRFYRGCVQRELWLAEGERTFLSQSTVFCGKMRSLLETFPDARFVVMERDPRETIPRLHEVMERSWKATDSPGERIDESLHILGRQSYHSYRYPLEVLADEPAERYAIVQYSDLLSRPSATVRGLYEHFGWAVSRACDERLAVQASGSASQRGEREHALEPNGPEAGEIREHLSDLFERFGWNGQQRSAG